MFDFLTKLPFKILILIVVSAALIMEIIVSILCIVETMLYFPPLLLLVIVELVLINELSKSPLYDVSSLRAFFSK